MAAHGFEKEKEYEVAGQVWRGCHGVERGWDIEAKGQAIGRECEATDRVGVGLADILYFNSSSLL